MLKKKNLVSNLPHITSIATRENGIRIFSLGMAALIATGLVFLLARGAFPTPFSDEFYFHQIYLDAKNGNIDLNKIFEPHFGHIYVLLKSWLWLVIHYDIDWRVSMYIQTAFVALAVAFVSKYSLFRDSKNINFLIALSVAFVLGSARQAENLYWAIQISAAAMILSSIMAFYFVERLSATQKNIYAGLAFVFASTALLSNGGGLVTFLITATAVFAISRRFYIKAICIVIGGLFVAGILSYMLPSKEAAVGASLVSAKNIFYYFLAFFANSLFSFSERGDDVYSLTTGAAVLILTTYTVISSWRQKEKNVFPYLLIFFSVASCVLIAYARLKGGIWQPNASRYYPFAAMILVGNMLVLGNEKGKSQKYIALVSFALISISFVQSYFIEWKISPHRYIYSKNAHFNLCSGNNKGLAFHGDLRYTNTTTLKDIFCTGQDLRLAEIKSQPVLTEIGPTQTNRQTPFNPQPDGESALWVRTENCENSCVLLFSETEIPTIANKDGTLLTAKIPKQLYESPGEKTVYIKNSQSGKKSKILVFHVY